MSSLCCFEMSSWMIQHQFVKVLTNVGLLGYSLENLWIMYATIAFAIAYTINSAISFLMNTVRCFEHNECYDFLYFSVTIFFSMITLTAAIAVLLSALSQLRNPTSSGSNTGHNNTIQHLDVTLPNAGEADRGSTKDEDAKLGEEEQPPAYNTLVPLP